MVLLDVFSKPLTHRIGKLTLDSDHKTYEGSISVVRHFFREYV